MFKVAVFCFFTVIALVVIMVFREYLPAPLEYLGYQLHLGFKGIIETLRGFFRYNPT